MSNRGLQLNSRYTNFRPVRTIWHGSSTKAFTNVLELQPQHPLFLPAMLFLPAARRSGNARANQAFKFQAKAVITMYAQLLSSVSTGACKARTPPFNCAIRFSWSQRSLAENTTSSAALTPVVGDVKEVANLVEQPYFALLPGDVLADHDHAIRLPTSRRPVVELGHLFALQPEVLEPAVPDNPASLTFSGRCRGCVFTS